jgi:glucan phosphoethanolaminetransferase (alkaline phosphatase superfamily)
MNTKLLRLAYTCEFLVGLLAIFTAWSEIGGQAALDLMHWGWKLGFSVILAGAVVAYSAAIVSADSLWTLTSARWLALIVLLIAGMGVVTYFYSVQVDAGQSDETGNVSVVRPPSTSSRVT